MKTQKYKWILYLITATIITTIAVQFFWNFKNYEENKQRVINEIQLSLDNAIEEYFATIAKDDFTTVINLNSKKGDRGFVKSIKIDSVFKNLGSIKRLVKKIPKDSLKKTKPEIKITNISITTDEKMSEAKRDSMLKNFKDEFNKPIIAPKNILEIETKPNVNLKYFKGQKAADSLKLLKGLKPIFFSVTSSFISYKELDSLLENQLKNKGIEINYKINHFKNDTIFHASEKILEEIDLTEVAAKSTFLKRNEAFKLQFKNPGLEALKRSSSGIILSLLLSLTVVYSLFYLLHIIKRQKELAVVKNDLISNITHEFKTPIATVSSAIEALENFNVLDDKEKTKKYLAMSSLQLKKLHQMVEKLLETATLDSEQLLLKKETSDIVKIIEKQVTKHQLLTKKDVLFSTNLKPIYSNIDVFHFENAISNLIDNAIKYGGSKIEINIYSILNAVEISVADDGKGIDKNLQEKIFDKFYRVPKGNTHDIKGFGIGLYYCKKIIEKHSGNITLTSTKQQTIFKITMPNA